MSSFLKDELGVAMSGVKWDIGNFKLWQSTRDDIILFTPKQPTLAKGENERYQFGVSTYRQQTEGTYKITGGSAIFTITSAIQYNEQEMERLKEQWRATVVGSGRALTDNPKFIPLNIRKGVAEVLINETSGVPDKAHNDKNVGTPGGTNSFLLKLTEQGAQEWAQAIKEKKPVPAGVKFTYEYLQMVPTIGARVTLNGKMAFEHLSASLNASYDGWLYGGSVKIDAAWEEMTRKGIVNVEFMGAADNPEVEKLRAELVANFSSQAQQEWFKILFQAKPDIPPAAAGSSGGLFGGANFALKWKKVEEAVDLKYELKFEGWTWLRASMDADCTTLFANLDESYLNEVNLQQSFPVSIVVDSDETLENVAMSLSASEGMIPATPVYGSQGGTNSYVVTSNNPDNVSIQYNAKVNFLPAKWPIIEKSGKAKVSEGGNQVIIKPSAWIGRHKIYMFVRDGDKIVSPSQLSKDDYIVTNVSYEGPHLQTPIKDSAKITPFEVLEFAYPLDPDGRPGQAKFSAFGLIGGNLVNAKEQPISFDEEAVFILADKKGIQLVSKASISSGEASRGGLPDRLVNAFARRESRIEGESSRPRAGEIVGIAREIEYGPDGPSLLIKVDNGNIRNIRLRDMQLVNIFKDACSKKLKIQLDSSGMYAEKVSMLLN